MTRQDNHRPTWPSDDVRPRSGGPTSRRQGFHIGSWQVDPTAREITDGISVRKLSPRAMSALVLLVEARGEVVRRQELLDMVWPDVYVGDESVTTALSELRRAFGETRGSAKVIETIQKTGYRLCVPVTASTTPSSEVSRCGALTDFDLDAHFACQEVMRLRQTAGPLAYEQALSLCVSAVTHAPRFATAHAEHAITVVFHTLYCGGAPSQLKDALAIAEHAVGLRPELANGHLAMGIALSALKRRAEAHDSFERALFRAPYDGETNYQCSRALFGFGELQNAGRAAELASTVLVDDYRPLYVAAAAYQALGDTSRARRHLNEAMMRLQRRLLIDPEEPRGRNAMAALLAWSGESERAMEMRSQLEKEDQSITYYAIATFASVGEIGIALDGLEQLVDDGYRQVGWLRHDPTLGPLLQEPRCKRLMGQLERI